VTEWERNEAAEIFLRFIEGPYFNKIARCKRKHCDRFLLKTRSDKVYCSQECASAVTAFQAVVKQRQQKRRLDVMRVRSALEKWTESSGDRTTWLSEETSLSKKFVTIALRELGA
jgi:hypothetical protein